MAALLRASFVSTDTSTGNENEYRYQTVGRFHKLWQRAGPRPSPMARVSDDHADESLCVEHMAAPTKKAAPSPRLISPEELRQHNGRNGLAFWAVVDSFVVDATAFVDAHPGGLKKLLSTDSASTGATGKPFGFSFSRGRNAHFPETGKRFHDGVKRFMSSGSDGPVLPPAEVEFPPHGKIVILGRLKE